MGIWETHKGPVYHKWKEYWFQTHPPEIADYSWDYCFTGGKEIRARLFCELWQYLSPDSEVCVELAFAIECIHVASLILDDSPWMDNASMRRGRKTLHLQFTEKKALLVCHDLMKMVYMIWLENKPPSIDEKVWKGQMRDTLEKLTIGQYYDLGKKGELVEVASLKTGVLFGFVTETVACCIQLDSIYWKEWGNRLGILFQWMDDWKDREEDILQENRNAFNEAPEWTALQYAHFWRDICKAIGSSWFHTDFGHYIHQYFTSIPIPFDKEPSISMELPLFLPLCTHYLLPSTHEIHRKIKQIQEEHSISLPFETSVELIQTLIYMIQKQEDVEPLRTDLWSLPEEKWITTPEIQEWIDRIHTEINVSERISTSTIQEWMDRVQTDTKIVARYSK